jgi:membrane protein implicated in regulation of membrane protease activity
MGISEPNLKLRLGIIGPAVVLLVALGILAAAASDLLRPVTIAGPVLTVTALLMVVLLKRSPKRRNADLKGTSVLAAPRESVLTLHQAAEGSCNGGVTCTWRTC